MKFKAAISVLGSQKLEDAKEGKPGYRITIADLKESQGMPGVPSKPEPGTCKSFHDLQPGDYLVEMFVGGFIDDKTKKAKPYAQIVRVLKGAKA